MIQERTDNNFDIRYPAFSGSWYSGNPAELQEEIGKYINQVKDQKIMNKPRVIIVPHPGIMFGGKTQAYSYKAISKFKYRNVFLIGVSHHAYFNSISLGDFDYYQTPLGRIKVNRDIISFLKNRNTRFTFEREAHEAEHSLEIQLPFLQTVLKDFQIVPILLSGSSSVDSQFLAENLYEAITPDDLIVISTDLSHYPKYEDANKIDTETIKAILSLNIDNFENRINKLKPENTDTFACGEKAIIASIILANKLNLENAKLLHYENSGDNKLFGDREQVVGYSSIAIFSSENEKFSDTANLSKDEKEILLNIARKSLAHYFDKNINYNPDIKKNSILNEKFGAFVTLKINNELRGCIGNFESDIPLYELIANLALDSAFRDTRFEPVSKYELKNIQIEISILSKLKKISTYHEIIPGKHGVYIIKGTQGGTYLPQVAVEQNWDREEMLNNLTRYKAGLDINCWKDNSADMFIYTANVFRE